jgi:ECF sigma factor
VDSLNASVNSPSEILEWRRSKVIELNSMGYSQPEIARTLQIAQSTVNRDLAVIRRQARETLKTHVTERLPNEYNRCLIGLNQVLKICWTIVNNPSTDDRTKLQATAVIDNCYSHIMDLTTNGVIVGDAIRFVQNKMSELGNGNGKDKDIEQQLQQQRQEQQQIEEETTTGVF